MSDIDISREAVAHIRAELHADPDSKLFDVTRGRLEAICAALDAAEAALAMEVSRGQHRNNERLEALNCNSTQASKIGQLMVKLDAAEADKRQAVLDAVSLACDHLTAMADLCDLMEPDATGGKTLRSAAAAIRNQGEPK